MRFKMLWWWKDCQGGEPTVHLVMLGLHPSLSATQQLKISFFISFLSIFSPHPAPGRVAAIRRTAISAVWRKHLFGSVMWTPRNLLNTQIARTPMRTPLTKGARKSLFTKNVSDYIITLTILLIITICIHGRKVVAFVLPHDICEKLTVALVVQYSDFELL